MYTIPVLSAPACPLTSALAMGIHHVMFCFISPIPEKSRTHTNDRKAPPRIKKKQASTPLHRAPLHPSSSQGIPHGQIVDKNARPGSSLLQTRLQLLAASNPRNAAHMWLYAAPLPLLPPLPAAPPPFPPPPPPPPPVCCPPKKNVSKGLICCPSP